MERGVFEDPEGLLLDMAQERSLGRLLGLVVERLARSERVALARIWLLRPGEDCARCLAAAACPDRAECLHLVASAGRSVLDPRVEWSGLDGEFRRVPLGARKVGRIASTGHALEVPDLGEAPGWIARPEWVQAERIVGFGGQPLVHHGRVLGVLAVFARQRIGEGCLRWLRMFADHAAAAIVNARAFEELEGLRARLQQENELLLEEVARGQAFGEMVGGGPALGAVVRQLDLVAPTDSTVLILGESGTGKELVAQELHRRSHLAGRALIKVNCAAIPRELYESEFFGHVRGAFTGALRDRVGRFERADGGTLFLDEVGEIPLDLQSKLLRVLQEGELERVGDERTRRVKVRVIAATNRDLRREAEAGRFRADLYYRLGVFPIEVPPLRRRLEDVPSLAEHFIEQAARRLGRPRPRLTLADVQRLQAHDWPGNVRELQHVVERAMITSAGGRLTFELPAPPEGGEGVRREAQPARVLTDAELRRLEADNLRAALRTARGKLYGADGAAALLGLKPTTLASRMKALGVERRGA
ncbi:MAG: sigma 54-interacting transcriptional regulator [Planctomycetes bacterium]|nr:sigma 54-interacting transcriptional regulator [Planctomycetota bacterium]